MTVSADDQVRLLLHGDPARRRHRLPPRAGYVPLTLEGGHHRGTHQFLIVDHQNRPPDIGFLNLVETLLVVVPIDGGLNLGWMVTQGMMRSPSLKESASSTLDVEGIDHRQIEGASFQLQREDQLVSAASASTRASSSAGKLARAMFATVLHAELAGKGGSDILLGDHPQLLENLAEPPTAAALPFKGPAQQVSSLSTFASTRISPNRLRCLHSCLTASPECPSAAANPPAYQLSRKSQTFQAINHQGQLSGSKVTLRPPCQASTLTTWPGATLLGDQRPGNAGLQVVLQVALERPGAIDRIVGGLGDEGTGRLGQLQTEFAVQQPLAQLATCRSTTLFDLLQGQRLEQHDIVDPVEKLGAEGAAQLVAAPARAPPPGGRHRR